MKPSSTDPAARLEQLWRQGDPPGLRRFLAEAGDLSPAEVLAVLRVDQRCRWQRGERIAAETYLSEWPAATAGDHALELICQEIQLRESLGELVSLEDLDRRFPQYASRLRQQIELYRDLASPPPQAQRDELPAKGDMASSNPRLPSIPGYELLNVVGRGTMSTVYRARQQSSDRLIAVKLILGGAHAAPAALARFRLEAETLGRLHHPNIVEIYRIGHTEDHVFCVLEYVDGGDLGQRLMGVPQPARQAARLIEQLALALDSVHRLRVVHRDLKPENILLTAEGDPKISDFGLAKWLERASHTRRGEVVGTPSYMAPEQADTEVSEIGPATDLYALGAILYEMLTGRPPFRGSNWVELVHQIRTAPPVPPSRLQPSVPRDLEAICLKCIEKEPRQRYSSAAALARDLEAFLAAEQID